MNSSLRQSYGPMLAQLIQDHVIFRQLKRMTLTLVATQLMLLVLHGGAWHGEVATLVLVCVPWALMQMWISAFLRSAIRQNRPEYACLVPHLRSRLIRLTAALYAAGVIVLAVMSELAWGHAGYGLMFGGLATVAVIFMNRYAAFSWGMALLIPFGTSFLINDVPVLFAQASETMLTLIVMPPLMLLAVWGLHLLLPRGGDHHREWQSRYSRRQEAMSGVATRTGDTYCPSRLKQLLLRFYLAALHRDSLHGAAPDRAMMHVIGPGAHPGRVIAYSLASTVLALLIGSFVSDGARAGMLTAVGLIQLGAVLMYAIGAADDVVLHGAEQQLYFLTPAAPAATQINRLLTAAVLRRALAVWLVSLACALILDSAQAGQATLRGDSFMVAMGMLWTLTPLLRNYAIVPARQLGLTWTVVTVVVVLICLGVLGMSHMVPDFRWYEVGGAAGISALIYLALRWRALMALPPVLPAGRLAV